MPRVPRSSDLHSEVSASTEDGYKELKAVGQGRLWFPEAVRCCAKKLEMNSNTCCHGLDVDAVEHGGRNRKRMTNQRFTRRRDRG